MYIPHSCALAGTYAGSLSARTKLAQCHSQVPTGRTHYNFSYALHGQRKNWSKSWNGDLALYSLDDFQLIFSKLSYMLDKRRQIGVPLWTIFSRSFPNFRTCWIPARLTCLCLGFPHHSVISKVITRNKKSKKCMGIKYMFFFFFFSLLHFHYIRAL